MKLSVDVPVRGLLYIAISLILRLIYRIVINLYVTETETGTQSPKHPRSDTDEGAASPSLQVSEDLRDSLSSDSRNEVRLYTMRSIHG